MNPSIVDTLQICLASITSARFSLFSLNSLFFELCCVIVTLKTTLTLLLDHDEEITIGQHYTKIWICRANEDNALITYRIGPCSEMQILDHEEIIVRFHGWFRCEVFIIGFGCGHFLHRGLRTDLGNSSAPGNTFDWR